MPPAREKNGERRVVVSTFVTLDGVLQAPGAPDEDRSSGFEHGGWQMPYVDDAGMAEITRGMDACDALLLGRRTYDIFAAFWPHQSDDDPIAARMNGFDKYVVSDTLTDPLWAKTTVIRRAEMVERVNALKRAPGKDLQVIGSGQLASALAAHDLVDEYHLMIHPLVLGSGQRLFGDVGRIDLELVSISSTPPGVVIARYVPAGRDRG